jgi:hypothetical protein
MYLFCRYLVKFEVFQQVNAVHHQHDLVYRQAQLASGFGDTSTGPLCGPTGIGPCIVYYCAAVTPMPGLGRRYRALSFSQSWPQPVWIKTGLPGATRCSDALAPVEGR